MHWLRLGWISATMVAVASLTASNIAHAGQLSSRCDKTCTISIGGQIEAGDERQFHDLALSQPNALILVTGPGGKVAPALAIGSEIRARGLRTLVPASASCASACSLIWLAGTQRMLGRGARIGFHALSTMRTGSDAGPALTETHNFDIILVRYLTDLGYANDVTATIVNTPSAMVHWRDAIELNANGIATQDFP